ncbi:hypothetical protein TW95_gp0269 [Pandoravirus inopinatum]|uniref:Uncharacterized protein n=1 Tax=Pandoravirus inopinatum TaxID=1605721 RepID=A0A0B5IWC9_9VIRU|nr:hypothetical protein TW95_gp0269 [Pandoravirus inopinatum]AJF97003.1 hypothetical protein [Pandoravirus inopinatum]
MAYLRERRCSRARATHWAPAQAQRPVARAEDTSAHQRRSTSDQTAVASMHPTWSRMCARTSLGMSLIVVLLVAAIVVIVRSPSFSVQRNRFGSFFNEKLFGPCFVFLAPLFLPVPFRCTAVCLLGTDNNGGWRAVWANAQEKKYTCLGIAHR